MVKFTSEELIKICKIIHNITIDRILTLEENDFLEGICNKYWAEYNISNYEKKKLVLSHAKDQAIEFLLLMLEPKTIIKIPRSHIDDFKKHIGWWAIFPETQIDLKSGDSFQFQLDTGEIIKAKATWIGKGGEKYPNFSNWTIIEYLVI